MLVLPVLPIPTRKFRLARSRTAIVTWATAAWLGDYVLCVCMENTAILQLKTMVNANNVYLEKSPMPLAQQHYRNVWYVG